MKKIIIISLVSILSYFDIGLKFLVIPIFNLTFSISEKVTSMFRLIFSNFGLKLIVIVLFNIAMLFLYWGLFRIQGGSDILTTALLIKTEWIAVLLRTIPLAIGINWIYNHMQTQTRGNFVITRVVTVSTAVLLIPVCIQGLIGEAGWDIKTAVAILAALRICLIWQELAKPAGLDTIVSRSLKSNFAKKFLVLKQYKVS
jgi:hypothetical protein